MVEQPEYDYFECRECEYSFIKLKSNSTGHEYCLLCAGDSGHDVRMSRRTARDDDVPEGRDARKIKECG